MEPKKSFVKPQMKKAQSSVLGSKEYLFSHNKGANTGSNRSKSKGGPEEADDTSAHNLTRRNTLLGVRDGTISNQVEKSKSFRKTHVVGSSGMDVHRSDSQASYQNLMSGRTLENMKFHARDDNDASEMRHNFDKKKQSSVNWKNSESK